MKLSELDERIMKEIHLSKKDKILHILKEKTMFPSLIAEAVKNNSDIHIIKVIDEEEGNLKKINFYKKIEDLKLDLGSLDLILFEDSFSYVINKREGFQSLKKYLTRKGKVAILEKEDSAFLKIFNLGKRKVIDDTMFIAGYSLKNQFNFSNNYYLLIYEIE